MRKKQAGPGPQPFPRVNPPYHKGLTEGEAAIRRQSGAHNAPPPPLTRSAGRIVRDNICTLFNGINLLLAASIVLVGGSVRNILFMGVAVCNTAIGIFQELRAKRGVDRLAIITQAKVTVIREGVPLDIPQEELVLDDIMVLKTGGQVCADGAAVRCEGLEMDESQLTGESRPVIKNEGDTVYSGSFVVSGRAYVRVTAVGAEGYAHRLAGEGRKEKKPASELTRALTLIIRVLTVVIIPVGILLFVSQYFWGGSKLEQAVPGTAAAMIGMIPEGLILLTGIAFALGALRLSRHNTLTQSMPSMETLARADVLCLDKTGTITDGTLTLTDIMTEEGIRREDAEEALSALVHALADENAVGRALRTRFPEPPTDWTPARKIPFSSARKWSGCCFAGRGAYVLGAPEIILRSFGGPFLERADAYAGEGFRVLALMRSAQKLTGAKLPEDAAPMALLLFADGVRDDAPAVLSFFAHQEVTLKVISGDNPRTAAHAAARAGLADAERCVDMSAQPEGVSLTELAERNTVFGRVSPRQKKELVAALQKKGHIVAMTGDGVNDVPALKQADCGIAMAAGSDAARHVADFVLLDARFSALVHVVREGRRVVGNIEKVASLYLVKTIYSTLLSFIFILLSLTFNLTYPFRPIHLTLISALTVGIPSFLLAFQPIYNRIRGHFLGTVLKISLPAALCVVTDVLIVQLVGALMGLSFEQCSMICVLVTGTFGFIVLVQAVRPMDAGKRLMIAALAAAFIGVFVLSGFFHRFFELTALFDETAFVWAPLLALAWPLYRRMSVWMLGLRRFVVRALRGKTGTGPCARMPGLSGSSGARAKRERRDRRP